MLKSLQEELTEKLDEKRSQKISKKYKMVKFFGEGKGMLTQEYITIVWCLVQNGEKSRGS